MCNVLVVVGVPEVRCFHDHVRIVEDERLTGERFVLDFSDRHRLEHVERNSSSITTLYIFVSTAYELGIYTDWTLAQKIINIMGCLLLYNYGEERE